MKTLRLLLTVAAAGSAVAMAADKKAPSNQVQVNFIEPEKFTDVKDGMMASDKGRDAILEQIRDYIVERAEPMLPPGYRLEIGFTDIDLAGDYEPWRSPQFSDVRIVKAIYPPRMKFGYRVLDASGQVVKNGSTELRDLTFQSRLTISRDDPLRYEKDMLSDWLRSEIKSKS